MNKELFKEVIKQEFFQNYKFENGVWSKDKVNNDQGYAKNFGLQWNKFKLTQFDSYNGTNNTRDRLFGCSGWDPEALNNKFILEIGSGAGRFTEVLLKCGAKVVSIDLSNAVYVNAENNSSNRLLLIKESIYNLPLNPNSFDYVLCYGVVQHTPNVKETYLKCINYVNSNGLCSFDHYKKSLLPNPFYQPKYIWRPITKKITPENLLKFIEFYIPKYFPVDTIIKKIPKIGNLIAGLIPIPCWNYTGVHNVNQDKSNLIEWAIMDTFDALGARYDEPWSMRQSHKFANELPVKGFHVGIGGNGILLNTFGNLNV